MAAPPDANACTFCPGFRVLTYNVDQAVREEAYIETRWNNRYKRIQALIHDIDADVVCLQELRRLPGSELTTRSLPSDHLPLLVCVEQLC